MTWPLIETAINPFSGKSFHCFERQPQPFAKSGHNSKIQILFFVGQTDIICVACSQLFSPLALCAAFHVAWPNLGSAGEQTLVSGKGGLALTFHLSCLQQLSSCLLKSLTSRLALFYILRLGHQRWSSCLWTKACYIMFRDRRRQHAVQQHQQSLAHSLVNGCKASVYAWWQRNQGLRLDITETSQKDDKEQELWG